MGAESTYDAPPAFAVMVAVPSATLITAFDTSEATTSVDSLHAPHFVNQSKFLYVAYGDSSIVLSPGSSHEHLIMISVAYFNALDQKVTIS